MIDLSVTLGRLRLANPILVASGTFGYAREMAGIVDFRKLGGIIPKDGHQQATHRERAAAHGGNGVRHAQRHRPG